MDRDNRPDRHLKLRGTRWHYVRRVPDHGRNIDPRWPRIDLSLRTSDKDEAMVRRSELEKADDSLWDALAASHKADDARERYDAALAVRSAYDLKREVPEDLLAFATNVKDAANIVKGIFDRIRSQYDAGGGVTQKELDAAVAVSNALLGTTVRPVDSVTEAMKYFVEIIAKPIWSMKSPAQIETWKRPKYLAAKVFVEAVGDICLSDISHDEALQFFEHLEGRMLDPQDKFGHDAAKRQLGDLKQLFGEYCQRHRIRRENPFEGLRLRRLGKLRKKSTRVPFSKDWVESKILGNPRLNGMGEVRRHALLVIAETGARPSEILNLTTRQIHLDSAVPYIEIDSLDEGDLRREVKTQPSIRRLPLVGVALAAMKHHPDGFPTLFDKGSSFSAAVNKFLRTNGMMESDRHTVYSLRHLAEDRLKAAGLSDDMRRQIMGHSIERESYGQGYTVEQLASALEPIAMRYDPAVLG